MEESRTIFRLLWRDRDSGSSKVVMQLGLAVVGIALMILFQKQLAPLKGMLLQRQTENISQEFIYGEASPGEAEHVHDFIYLSEGRHWCHCGAIEQCTDGSDPDEACDVCGHGIIIKA